MTSTCLPQLPLDVWFRISLYLDPPSLSSLSQVNKSLHKIATDESHFRRYHTAPNNPYLDPEQLYRRFRALSYIPNLETSVRLPDRVNILCAVHDTLLLHDRNSSRIVAFPKGTSVEIAQVLDPLERDLSWLYLRARMIKFPGPYVGFKSATRPACLTVLNVCSWEVRAMNMGEQMKPLIVGTVYGKPTMLAGEDAEWIMYYTDEGSSRKIVFYDWRTGAVVKEIANASKSLKFLMGECPIVDGMTVVGVVSETSDGFTREVHIKSFDSCHRVIFSFSPDQNVEAILRSEDTMTHVLVVSKMCAHNVKRLTVIWSREEKEKVVSGGRSLPTTTVPELRENGHVIVAKYSPNWSDADDSSMRPKEVWIFLNSSESQLVERCTIRVNKYSTSPKWLMRTREGGLAVMVRKEATAESSVDLVKFETNRETATGPSLNEWVIPGGVNNFCTVADHFVVMSGLGRRLHLLHFDRFCRGGKGVYACPEIFPKGYTLTNNAAPG